MEEEPHPKRLQLHQPSQSATQEDAVAHMKAAEETLSDEKSRMVDNAISYLKAVKETFKDDQEKYIGFLQVMKDFKLSGVVTDEMMNRLKGMFEGHSSLLVGLNSFLPRGYEITDTSIACPPRKMELDDRAVIYIQKIKARFQNDDKTIYKSFQKMLKMFWQGDISQHDLHQQVQLLFCNHEDLLEDFRRFLPKPMDSDHVPPLQDSAKPSSGYISGLKSVRHSYKENMAKRQKTIDINSNHHDIFQSPLREDIERTSVDIENGNLKKGHKEKHLNKISKLKLKDRGETRAAQNRETELDAIYHCPYSRTLTSRSDVLIPEKRLMGQVYGSHEENSPQDPPMDCSKTLINVSRQKIDFCKKVKGKIVNTQLEKDNMTSTEQDYGKDRHRDNDRSCRSRDKLNNNALPISSNDEDISPQGRDFCKKVKRKLSNTKLEKENEQNTEQHHGKDRHRDNDQSCRSTDKLNNNASTMLSKGKGTDKPISEFCLSDSEHCTPSYCLLPQNYLKPVASYCTDLAAEVLNDCCVTMTSGSEDNSFKHMQKNCYEEILFRCEDDRYELDMRIESTVPTITRINELLKKLQDSTIKRDDHIQIEEHLTALNLRCIEQLYCEHGLEVIDLLHENPGRALPVIQKRLQEKKDELSNCRSEYNKVWAYVFAKHYRKSLDHRSFYFKQQDKESLSTKALKQDIKEISERKRKEDGVPLAIVAGNSPPLIPHLKYKFPDHALNEELYELIKHSLDQVCTNTEESDKTMRIWTIFFDCLFGVSPQSNVADDRKDLAEFNNCNSSQMDASKVKSFGHTSWGNLKENAVKVKKCGLTSAGNLKKYSTAEAEQTPVQDYQNHAVDQSLQNGGISEMQYSQTLISNIDDVTNTVKPGSCLNILNSGGMNSSCIAGTSLKFSRSSNGLDDCVVFSTEKDLQVAQESDWKPLELERENGLSDYNPDTLNSKCSDDEHGYGGLKVERAKDRMFLSVIGDHKEEDDVGRRDNEGKAESESKVEKLADQHAEDLSGSSDCFAVITKSLTEHVDSTTLSNISEKKSVFYGNDAFYVLCRLYQTLYERVHFAQKNLLALQQKMKNVNDIPPPKMYSKFMDLLYSFLDGLSGNIEFEDNCQEIIGTEAYILFTLDNLIFKLVKQLQNVASGKMEKDLLELGLRERLRSTSSISDVVYHVNASRVLNGEKIYRFEFASYSSELSLQLVDIDAKVLDPAFTDYLHTDLLPTVLDMKRRQKVFLSRNMCKYTSVDEHCCLSKRMKGVTVVNGLHRVISCWRSKASYARSTEDFMIWKKPKKQRISAEPSQSSSITSSCYHDKRVLQFHELSSSGKASLSQGSKTSHGYCTFNATSNSKLN